MRNDRDYAEVKRGAKLDFIYKDWGVDVLIVLTVDEKSILGPNVTFNTPIRSAIKSFSPNVTTTNPQSYGLTVGGQLSLEGYRQEKLHIFYKISELVGPIKDIPRGDAIKEGDCPYYQARADLFLQSDLKIYDWLSAMFGMQQIQEIDLSK